MNTRPILDPDSSAPRTESDASQSSQPVSAITEPAPLAIDLPDWDLVPADSLLVRRRAAKV